MNYKFRHDINGKPVAHFEMGGETFSRWFTDELSNDTTKISEILKAIDRLSSKQIKEFNLPGKDISLHIDVDEVEVRSKDLDYNAPDELPEGTELYDQESLSGCGLEDFLTVLESWQDFIANA